MVRCHDVKRDIGSIAVIKGTIISNTSYTLIMSVVDVGKPTVALPLRNLKGAAGNIALDIFISQESAHSDTALRFE